MDWLLTRRRLMMKAGAGEIPAGFAEIPGISFDGDVYYVIDGFYLKGSDTLKFSFKADANCNVIGCYAGASAENNFSLYVVTTGRYLRYNGATYNSRVDYGTRYDVTISPTGTSGMRTDSSWTEQSFTCSVPLCIGLTAPSGVTSSPLVGKIYGRIEVVGREVLIPVRRLSDGAIGYYGKFSGAFYVNQGEGTPKLVCVQRIQNGNFSYGITGWTPRYGATLTASDGVGRLTAGGAERLQNRAYQSYTKDGHMYYVAVTEVDRHNCTSAYICFTSGATILSSLRVGIYATLGRYDGVISTPIDTLANRMAITLNTSDADGYIEFTDVIFIDLTATFGAGNEPTLEQCRQIFTEDYYEYYEPNE